MPLVERVLFICTANQCRSPVAAALLARLVTAVELDVEVSSAGLLPGGVGAASPVVAICNPVGLDLSEHVSQQVTQDRLGRADLIIGMERAHVREVVLMDPSRWGRTFTLRELIRRGSEIGPRRRDESLEAWLESLGEGRRHSDLLGASDADDLADPMGGPPSGYAEMLALLETLTGELAHLLWGIRAEVP